MHDYEDDEENPDRLLIENLLDRTHDLVESIKADIQKKGVITDKTVIALNELIVASNQFEDVMSYLKQGKRTLN